MQKILAIDDKTDNLITLSALIKNLMPDCTVITAQSGKSGIEQAKAQQPDVILLDVKMPDMDGFETCRRLKDHEETRHIPVLMMTAIRTDAPSRIQGLEIGADAFISKPIDESELVSQVKVALRIKRAEDDLRRQKDALEQLVEARTASLRESQERFQGLADDLPALVCEYMPDSTLTYVNKAYCDYFGLSREDLLGRPFLDFVPEEEKEFVRKTFLAFTPENPLHVFTHKVIRNGEIQWQEWRDRALFDDQDRTVHFRSIGFDITDRRQAEEKLKAANTRLHALWTVTSLGRADVKTISDHVLATITKMTGSAYGFYGFLNEDESAMIIHSWSGEAMEKCSITDKPTLYPIRDAGVWGEAIRQRKPLILNDYGADHPSKKGLPQGHVVLTNLLVVPFMTQDRITSVAAVANRVNGYDENDVNQLTSFLYSIQAVIDSKRAEDALRNSEMRWRNVLVNTPQLGISLDPQARVVFANRRFLEVTGWTEGDVLGCNWFDRFIPEDLREEVLEVFRMAMGPGETKGFSSYENEILTRSGERRMVAWSNVLTRGTDGTIADVTCLGVDLTERKRAEEENRYQAAQISSLLDAIPDLVFFKDLDGVYLSCNAEFARHVGRAKEDIIGKTDYDLYSSEEAKTFREYDLRMLERGEPRHNEEWIFYPDGQRVLLDTLKTPFRDLEGKVIGSIGVSRDITERRRDEEERANLQAQLNQAQKLESVGRLAGGVAHDFNNMLGVILGHAEMALEEVEPSRFLHRQLEQIQKTAKRSTDLVRQLLAFARKQTIAPEVLDLNDTVSGMLKMLMRLIGEDIDLVWMPGASLWSVRMDPSQIDQILANLCVNARDAIADVGRITIESENVVLGEDYGHNHADFAPGEYVMLAVSDDGCGMDKEVLKNLFEPFFTTKELGKGTGLGLATVYGIVKQNNGLINVYSEPDKGTTFKIYLPRHVAQEPKKAVEAAPQPLKGGEETVLLVEDEPILLDMGKSMLGRFGYQVLAAGSPAEAIRVAKEYPGEIHLLMTDMVMPMMNGSDLARDLKSQRPNLACLFMSGYTADVIAHQGVLEQGFHFIQKPFSMKELAAKVREVLDSRK